MPERWPGTLRDVSDHNEDQPESRQSEGFAAREEFETSKPFDGNLGLF
jgi:hypothetical protein